MMDEHKGAEPNDRWRRGRRAASIDDDVQASQDARISALLGEMRPHQYQATKKAHTTNIVDVSQLAAKSAAIYGSWQDRRPLTNMYGSQQVVSSTLPKYDQLYCNTNFSRYNASTNTLATAGRREPPEYSKYVTRPIASWQVTASEIRPSQSGSWLKNSRPLARGALSPAAYFQELEHKNASPNANLSVAGVGRFPANSQSSDVDRMPTSSSSDSTLDSENIGVEKRNSTTNTTSLVRSTPRQASFMAAMTRSPLRESTSFDSNNGNEQQSTDDTAPPKSVITYQETPLRRPRGREAASSFRRQQSSKSMGRLEFDFLRTTQDDEQQEKEEVVVRMRQWNDSETRKIGESTKSEESENGGKREKVSGSTSSDSVDSNHNEAMKMIRRARPKSYVLATSASLQDDVLLSSIANEPSSSISHETTTSGRDLPSSLMGSTTSIDHHRKTLQQQNSTSTMASSGKDGQHTSRSLNAPHPPATHRLQRFIALFNSNFLQKSHNSDEPKKSRMKRSRTSLPSSRFSLPGTILSRDDIDRQTWVKHQEIALGKSGKRHHWEDRWAILSKRSLFLCIESPSFNSEKTVELGSHHRIDVHNSIVDIAYDWLSTSFAKQRHVVRIVTQNRSEHLIELNTESEMLSWISILQSNSEDMSSSTGGGNEQIMSGSSSKENNNHVMMTTSSPNHLLHNSHSIASLASSSCSTTTSELVSHTQQQPLSSTISLPPTGQQQQQSQQQQGIVNGLTSKTATQAPGNQQLGANYQLPTSKSFGGLSNCQAGTTKESAKNQLIMHRYIAKNSQLQSPTSSKKMEIVGGQQQQQQPSTTPTTSQQSCQQYASTSKDNNHENGVELATTPKSGRKWKKSKAGKQGSGGASGAGGNNQQQQSSGGGVGGQSVLGVKVADCAMGGLVENVPMLVQVCVCVVESYGMDTVGIYRIPGNTAAVNTLKESLSNRGFDNINLNNIESLDPRWRDVNVVSSLLKMFLRKLPEPLLTDKLYPFFIDANRISTHHNRVHKLRNLLRKLPRPHYDTLRYLIIHLFEITRHSDVNKMECRNLALMFGPSIVRPSDDNMATMVTHMSDQCKIIETLIHYHDWMFDETSTAEDASPEQHPADGQNPLEPGSYGVGVPTGVSAASFNDMHNLIRKANEDQAAAMMNEGKGQKIKNMLRRNSRRDKSKSKLKIESTAPAAMNPKWQPPTTSNTSVESAFCGNYQERDIDAEIESRQTVSPPAQSGIDQSPSLESSLGSLPDTSRTEPIYVDEEAARKRRQEELHSARRMFIAGNQCSGSEVEKEKIDALANHSQHLHIAGSPAFEVLSEETREKIRRMQKKQSWHDTKDIKSAEFLKTYSPTKDLTDAVSCTSDYSTTSSAHLSTNPPLAVACSMLDQPNSSSDYASSDPSPCARNPSTSPASRPSNLVLTTTEQPNVPMSRSQKIRMRTKLGIRDPTRRHTLSDVDTLKEGRLDKLARWFGIRKSSPDVSRDEQQHQQPSSDTETNAPVVIVRTSPNELTPVSGDELL